MTSCGTPEGAESPRLEIVRGAEVPVLRYINCEIEILRGIRVCTSRSAFQIKVEVVHFTLSLRRTYYTHCMHTSRACAVRIRVSRYFTLWPGDSIRLTETRYRLSSQRAACVIFGPRSVVRRRRALRRRGAAAATG
ncbi:hypothetical protein EVAR_99168_1 [Eumeta japonica]|uniref:Uncharacterized protein n=1 Tax=Eumeta variegata TaxID=151549 RepID=A0A4C1S9P6_EUMVA|nr:hypothetical protein EVAR_99168_1 [Eumeta japonica]